MDLVLIALGFVGIVAGWRMQRPANGMTTAAVVLVLLGAVALVIGSIIFGVAFTHGFERGLRDSS